MTWGRKTGGGSRLGKPNKVTTEFRAAIKRLLEDNGDKFQGWLTQVAEGYGTGKNKQQPDPGKALDLVAKLAEYAAPKLARTEVTGADGGPIVVTATKDDEAL